MFAGCGGLSLGPLTAGWTGLFAAEKDDLAFETLKHNLIEGTGAFRYQWPEWLPKEPTTINRLIKIYGHNLKQLRGKVDLIAGGPPCQGFSMAGRRRKDDPRNTLFRQYIKVVDAIKPSFLLLENVRGIDVEFGKKANEKKNGHQRGPGRPRTPFSEKIKRKLEAIGYAVFPKLVKASDFGVPQRRPRYIIIAIERELLKGRAQFDPFELLETVRVGFLREKQLLVDIPVSVKEALSDLEMTGKGLIDCVDSRGFKQIIHSCPADSLPAAASWLIEWDSHKCVWQSIGMRSANGSPAY